jgi:serine/threonine protein kinase
LIERASGRLTEPLRTLQLERLVVIDLSPGALFCGEYRIVRPLAEGGMGRVYVAEQLTTARQRALKVMSPLLVADEKSVERFVQEARIGARIDSDHVVEVVDAGVSADGHPWLAMELLSGETLTDRVEKRGPLSLPEAREAFSQLAHALSRAHDAGLVHRDLKPDNLFLASPRRDGVPFTLKLLDFGIAKLIEDSRVATGTQSVGSPLWLAPEQANMEEISPATDVWSIGLVAFFTLTGRSYWKAAQGGNMTNLLVEMLMDPLDPASARSQKLGGPPLPDGFDAWFAKAVARPPEERFPNARAALDALAAVLTPRDPDSQRPAIADPTPVAAPSMKPAPVARSSSAALWIGGAALGLLGVSALAAAAFYLGSSSRVPQDTPAPIEIVRTLAIDAGAMEPMAPRDPPPPPPPPPAAPSVEPPAVDAGPPAPRRPPPIASTAAGRELYASLVRGCWMESAPHPAARVRFELTLEGTAVRNVRVPPAFQGTPFARCVVMGLSRVRFSQPPASNVIVLDLPAAP